LLLPDGIVGGVTRLGRRLSRLVLRQPSPVVFNSVPSR
jgi:hypothetical protein